MNDDKKEEQSKVINLRCHGCHSCGGIDPEKAASIFAESIKDDIRQEDLQKLWAKYGKAVCYAIAGLLVAGGVYTSWQRHTLEEKEAIASRFVDVQMAIVEGFSDKVVDQLKELTNVGYENYSAFAKFEYAALLRRNMDKQAVDVYKSIYDASKVDKILKILAYVMYANASVDLMDAKQFETEVNEMVKTLSADEFIKGPWSMIAQEALAFCYIRKGEKDKAKSVLSSLVKTEGIPASMVERTRILIQFLSEKS